MARFGSLDTQYFDDAGDPLVSGKIYFYESGTTTPKATYADVNYTIANSNPVILTAAGRQPNIFFEGVAKAILTKSDNTQILVRDPVGDTASTFGNAWIASKDYNANDVVQGSDGEFYVSLINGNVNNNPVTTTGSWTFLYSVEWNAGTTYKLGSVVTYQTIVYQSLQNSNLNQNPSTSTTYWVPIQLVWSSTTTYAINANVVGTDGILYTSLQNANTNHIPASSPSWWVGTSAAAASSASAAASSASAAATSASNAATSASNAAASASTASTQATNASNYASAASTSATNASNSASAASTSASNAATSASNAAASYDLFDDRYLGAKASDPTVDNDGNPLVTGAMYFNTVSNTTRIYNGSGWQDSAAIATSINLASQVTGTLPVANGGTGATTLTANNVILGNGTSAVQFVAPGTNGNVLTSNGTAWTSALPAGSEIVRVARTSNTALATANLGNLIDITSGTFTQTFDAAATLGDGWFCYIRNSGTGDITLDPNSSETIDGLTSYIMYPGEVRLVQCDGTALRTVVLSAFYRTFTAGGTFTKPPGYAAFSGLLWGAGGSGGKGGSGGRGSGGGGGASVPFTLAASAVGSSETVTIGAGGAAITAGATVGNAGGNSTFGSLVTAYGGGAGFAIGSASSISGGGGGGALGVGGNGSAGNAVGGRPRSAGIADDNSGFGGTGGSVTGSGYFATYGGAAGGNGQGSGAASAAGASLYGGGGGGGQGTAGIAGGTSVYGGAGGNGGTTASGTDGTAPAGGGGGTITGATSGAGARGELRIWGIV